MKKKIKLFLLRWEIKILEKYIDRIELNLYFDSWSGKDCIEEMQYRMSELDTMLTKYSTLKNG